MVNSTFFSPAGRLIQMVLGLLILGASLPAQGPKEPLRFSISFDPHFSRQAQTGTVYLLISPNLGGEPRRALNEGSFEGFLLSRKVTDWKAGEPLVFTVDDAAYPAPLLELPPGRYAIQALLDTNPTRCQPGASHGNGHSFSRRLDLDPATSGKVELVIKKEILRRRREDQLRVHHEYIESRLVGRQIGHRFFVHAAVIMPINATPGSNRTWPVQYWFADLGEDTRSAIKYFQRRGLYTPRAAADEQFGKEFIFVLLDSQCREGYHFWADSPRNGSFRRALFDEILPHLESSYPMDTRPAARFLVGKGAGGLTALNLLSERPNFYAGAWTFAPDPVDYHDFFGLDLYANPLPNAFRDTRGRERILARREGAPLVSIKQQVAYEQVLPTGSLFHSYDAAFSPLGDNLRSIPLIDPTNGNLNSRAVRRFRGQDFLARLQQHWDQLGPALEGKIHIQVGAEDEFFLNRGAASLASFLQQKKARHSIEILKGIDHAGVDAFDIQIKAQKQMLQRWLMSSGTAGMGPGR